MEQKREFAPADRYKYDTGICSLKNGFSQIDTKQDAPYYGTWANPTTFVIVNYCEGDVCVTTCESKEEFIQEIMKCKQWNDEAGFGFAIDPGWNESDGAPWRALGLGELLH
jgi:hypothetical protein